MKTMLRICTVHAAKPLADVLASHVLAQYGDTPENLTKPLIFLPSRRACRALREAFLRTSEGRSLLLPAIRPLGDMDEEELFFSNFDQEAPAELLSSIAPAVPPVKRRLMLSQLVLEHGPANNMQLSLPQAFKLADALAELFDEIGRQQLDFTALAKIVPEEFSEHWQLTYGFLVAVARHWPRALAEAGYEEAVLRRNMLLGMLSKYWRTDPPQRPVIAAGSTGSIPAVAELLKTIAGLPNGMVVLHGLDQALEEDAWSQLGPTHPQYGLAQLLEHLEISRNHVQTLDVDHVIPSCTPAREAMLREALRPAKNLENWQRPSFNPSEAMRDFYCFSAHTQLQEAQTIAVLLRETLETPGKTAVCITRDRKLARMVIAQMHSFDVTLDDSSGTPLASMPAARFLQLCAECIAKRCAPVALLALLKHPLARAGLPAGFIRPLVRELEVEHLRGLITDDMHKVLTKAGVSGSKNLRDLLARFLATYDVFAAHFSTSKPQPLQALLQAHLQFAQWLSTDETGSEQLWQGQEGADLAEFMATLMEHGRTHPIPACLYPVLLDSFLQRESFRAAYGLHPRLSILSPIEARLQSFDRVILAGLNEGNWPPVAQASPWLSRPMQQQFGLPTPEVRLGQSAHDFSLLALGREVFLTRSEKERGSPATPSRWLVRLQALMTAHLPEGQWPEVTQQDYVQALNQPHTMQPIETASGRAPLTARPQKLRVTDIEKLMADPYGIYARYVLDLKKLDALEMQPSVREFGMFAHKVMEDFTKRYPDALPTDMLTPLREFTHAAFAPLMTLPIVRHYWLPRFEQTLASIIHEERARRAQLSYVYAELDGHLQLTPATRPIRLTTRIDRLEVTQEAALNVIDYKTGGMRSPAEVRQGKACQLPLMALVLRDGELKQPVPEQHNAVEELMYWKLSGSKSEIASALGKRPRTPAEELIEQARTGLMALLAAFENPSQAYHASPVPGRSLRYNDYEHLTRREEWDVV